MNDFSIVSSKLMSSPFCRQYHLFILIFCLAKPIALSIGLKSGE